MFHGLLGGPSRAGICRCSSSPPGPSAASGTEQLLEVLPGVLNGGNGPRPGFWLSGRDPCQLTSWAVMTASGLLLRQPGLAGATAEGPGFWAWHPAQTCGCCEDSLALNWTPPLLRQVGRAPGKAHCTSWEGGWDSKPPPLGLLHTLPTPGALCRSAGCKLSHIRGKRRTSFLLAPCSPPA